MPVTISVPVAVWGADWGRFVGGYFEAIDLMTRKPDEIILGLTDPDETGCRRMLEDIQLTEIPLTVVTLEEGGSFSEWWNRVFDACTSDWLAPCCIDDRFLPDALTEIQAAEDAGAELLVDAIRWKYRGDEWRGYWDAAAIGRVLTLPGAAPFRRSLYDKIGGFRSEIYSSDWAFYMDAAALGVKTYQASTVRIIFDEGNAHATRSGVQMSPEQRDAAYRQVFEYAERLGLR
jgi:hypothetical protein